MAKYTAGIKLCLFYPTIVLLWIQIGTLSTGSPLGLIQVDAALSKQVPHSVDPCADVAILFGNGTAVFPSQFKACLDLFPLNISAAYQTLDSIKKTMAVYVFEFINGASPTPFLTNNVNITAQLEEIAARLPPPSNSPTTQLPPQPPNLATSHGKPFTNEHEFQDALYSLYHSTNDAHTVYSTNCFQGFGFVKTAFPLVSVVENGRQKIRVAPNPGTIVGSLFTKQSERVLNITLADYANSEVVLVDGQPALDSVLNYVRYYEGNARDISCRLNAAMARPIVSAVNSTSTGADVGASVLQYLPGGFSSRQNLFMNDSITFVVQRFGSSINETLHVPWLVKYLGQPFTDATSYFQNQCLARPRSANKVFNIRGSESGEPSYETKETGVASGLLDVLDLSPFDDQSVPQGDAVHIVYDNFVKAYLLGVSGVGVVLVPSENLYNPSQTRPSPLIQQIVQALSAILQQKATKLILDFQNNGGGDIIDGYTVPLILFPNQPLHQFPTQFRAAPLIVDMVDTANATDNQNSLFWWGNWADLHGEPLQNSSNFFFPLQAQTWGGVADFFSKPFADQVLNNLGTTSVRNMSAKIGNTPRHVTVGQGNVTDVEALKARRNSTFSNTVSLDALMAKLGGPSPAFPPENILFLTNGLCQSTCALVGAYMQSIAGVKTLTVGGIANQPMEIENTGGGQVVLFESFLAEISNRNLEASLLAPQPFPLLKTSFSFTLRQALSFDNESIPLEFTFVASDHRVPYTDTNVFDIGQLYMDVAQIFLPIP